ncbi:precorrin-3B synthase [Microvirga antarctica]|uniref:precorrin-3B synthase n=1 Tax=Microvirga antarctica TaxID=2819233 RepID=UPI001B30F125|nr:precorrin-3B synthase [Microvirga antarctica]
MTKAATLRRGWCPDMLRPMATGDGLLVRVHPQVARLTARQADAIADAAARWGNGLLDLSSRGNIQIRGVSEATHRPLVEHLIGVGLMDGVRGESPYRLTTLSPLAGCDPTDRVDALALAQSLETLGQALTGLHPKFSIVVDGGGAVSLADREADLRFVGLTETLLCVGVDHGHDVRWIGTLAAQSVAPTAGKILAAFSDGGPWAGLRLRDLTAQDVDGLIAALPRQTIARPPARAPCRRAGRIALGALSAFFLAPPYGRCNASMLVAAAEWSRVFGHGDIRLSPFKGLVIRLASGHSADTLAALAREAGFIADPDDSRLRIETCPGIKGCTRGTTPTHEDADLLAAALPKDLSLHVSGCLKGCARPAPADVTLVGSEGVYAVVLGGTARDKPIIRAGLPSIARRLAATADGTPILRAFEETSS